MDTTEQIYNLVKQWCYALDKSRASEALRQIAIITGCIPHVRNQLTEKQDKCVVRWLKENHPNAYLWAMGQHCIGHPAALWGKEGGKL